MADPRGGLARWSWTMAAALAVASASLASFGADDSSPAEARTKGASKKPVEVIRSLPTDDVDGQHAPAVDPIKAKGKPTLMPSELDALIEKGLAASKTPVSEPTGDEEFIRRLYLDLLGKIPAPYSIRQFVASRDRSKRARLIDALLEHPDFADNWARYWRDVIAYRSPVDNDRQVDYPLFVGWLSRKLAANEPWDKIAVEIITAKGRTDDDGSTVFAMAEEVSPVEMAGEVSRVFMGIQIQCAQCHDHPSDPWKRQQFHEFAAFFSGLKRQRVQKAEKGQRAIFEIAAGGATHYSMADLKQPEKKIPVSPRFFLGNAPKVSEQVKADQRLILAANYVASPENPWFAKSFINRTWYALMGEGFYNPVDDIGPARTPNSPEVLELLTEQWVRSGYDVRWLFRTILTTQAYQRQSRATNSASGRVPFAANAASRLRSDQIFDALVQALNLEKTPMFQAAAAKAKAKEEMSPTAEKSVLDNEPERKMVNQTFGIDPSTPNDDVVGTIPQALYLMNGPLVTQQVHARPNTMLGQLCLNAPSEKAAVDALYLKVLARHPNAKEEATCLRYINNIGDRREAMEDILWSLINSTEFVSRR